MKILVVGCNGLLGQELVARSRLPGTVFGEDIDTCDITRPEGIEAVLDSVRPDWVINSAAYADVDGCESNPEKAWAINAVGAGNLARSCRVRGVGIIHLSTDFVFDGRKGTEYTEEDAPSPINIYGESKLGGEENVIKAGGRYIIIRTSWLFGRGGKNFPDTILNAAQKTPSLQVVSDQIGSPTCAPDLADAIGGLIREDARGIIHITNRGHCSWAEYATYVLKIMGVETEVIPVSTEELARPALRPAYSVLSTEKYEEITGRRMRTWQEAVRDYLGAKK